METTILIITDTKGALYYFDKQGGGEIKVFKSEKFCFQSANLQDAINKLMDKLNRKLNFNFIKSLK